jgi:2-polyprenyl-3-methyl-5-hydroxy-6-metoxy-1,4-benzoquinol methylase
LGAIVAAEYILKLLPAGTHDWNKFITPDELNRFLSNANLVKPIGL